MRDASKQLLMCILIIIKFESYILFMSIVWELHIIHEHVSDMIHLQQDLIKTHFDALGSNFVLFVDKVLAFMIKFGLLKINLSWVNHHKPFLHLVIMLKITSDNNCESHIEVPEEVCSHIDQNLNEDHNVEQNSESDQSVWMSTRIKKPPEYLKDYHCNLNVSNTSSKVKYP